VSIPAWLYKLGAIGGFGGFVFLFQNLFKPMFSYFKEKHLGQHDKPVWDVLITPNMKLEHWTGGKACYSKTEEIPYTIQEIAEKTKRPESSVLASLKRFKKRGDVKELPSGWQRT